MIEVQADLFCSAGLVSVFGARALLWSLNRLVVGRRVQIEAPGREDPRSVRDFRVPLLNFAVEVGFLRHLASFFSTSLPKFGLQ